MKTTAPDSWISLNQQYLTAALKLIRNRIEQVVSHSLDKVSDVESATVQTELQNIRQQMSSPPALELLCASLSLSPFEREVLVLSAGIELDSSFPRLCAEAHGDSLKTFVTFSLALSTLTDPHWTALTPTAPLRYWRLIEVDATRSLTQSPLRIDERILHYLAGVQYTDERLADILDTPSVGRTLAASHQLISDQLSSIWQEDLWNAPLMQLCGPDFFTQEDIVETAANKLGIAMKSASANSIPTSSSELEAFIRLWQREVTLRPTVLLLRFDGLDIGDVTRGLVMTRLVQQITSPLVVSSRERHSFGRRHSITFEIAKPYAYEQLAVWKHVLGDSGERLNGHIEALISQYDLHPSDILSVGAELRQKAVIQNFTNTEADERLKDEIWDACRRVTRPHLRELAQQIESPATWDDLVLPLAQKQLLRDIGAHVRQRFRVYEEWGFQSKGNRGLGISALFTGESGTGKTMAAEVLANELRLDLYRIDLSQLVSKYIGETEKNLRRVFDTAEGSGAILLFDEADALFGKRSEVRDSHDRYANIEVSYLLQRMESYRGLAILTTNMKKALDAAFLRRIRFAVQFPFPDALLREQIWRRIFPSQTPRTGIDAARLAKLNVSGGNIRNIALTAAFLAADAREPVRMNHLLRAAQSEYAKLEKPLTGAEIDKWM